MGIKWILRTLACISLLAASTAWSAEIHGRSSTQFQWYNDFFTEKKVAEFGQYLNLSVNKLDKEDKITIQGYGRINQDVLTGEGFNGRLYYLNVDFRDQMNKKVDATLGRQFVNYAAGSALVDGGRIDLKNTGPVAFSIMGGRNVFFDLKGEGTRANDYVAGVAAYLAGYQKTDAEISYFVKLDKDGWARDQLGASFKQYLFDSVKVYANTRFELASESFSELLTGIKYFPTANLVFTGEWYHSYPTFDATSIYSVFGVEKYQEAVLRTDYTINDKLAVNFGYTKQLYGDANVAEADVFEIGCRIRPLEIVQLTLNYDHRNGYGGKLNGGIFEVSVEPIKPLELTAGLHFDVYERDRATGQETARKYFAGAKYKIKQNMSASVRIEDNVNAQYSSDWAGRAVFNYDF